MAAITSAVIGAGAALYGAEQQRGAAKSAANAEERAAQDAQQYSEQNYQRTATNLNPYITSGQNALGTINALNSGDYSSFTASPDYQFSLTQGLQGLDRSAAARGSLYSGGQTADTLNYAEGLASQNYNNYYSKLANLAGMGQSAASNLGSVGTGNAAQVGNYLTQAGSAAANGAYNTSNANSNLASQLANLAGQYGQQYASSYTNPYSTAPTYTGASLAQPTLSVSDLAPTKVSALYG